MGRHSSNMSPGMIVYSGGFGPRYISSEAWGITGQSPNCGPRDSHRIAAACLQWWPIKATRSRSLVAEQQKPDNSGSAL